MATMVEIDKTPHYSTHILLNGASLLEIDDYTGELFFPESYVLPNNFGTVTAIYDDSAITGDTALDLMWIQDSESTEAPEEGVIYLVPVSGEEEGNDTYEEYMWINGAWERIGSTSIDLSQYYTKEEIDNKTNTINQSITAAVSDINILNTWVNTQFDPDVRDIIDAEVSQDITNLTTTVNNLSNQLVSGSKYVYEDGNGNVIITKDNYLGKFVVHPDRTSLYVGEAELAYVKDGKLYANQIKTNGLQIGSWLYELTANGTLNEKWVGGE